MCRAIAPDRCGLNEKIALFRTSPRARDFGRGCPVHTSCRCAALRMSVTQIADASSFSRSPSSALSQYGGTLQEAPNGSVRSPCRQVLAPERQLQSLHEALVHGGWPRAFRFSGNIDSTIERGSPPRSDGSTRCSSPAVSGSRVGARLPPFGTRVSTRAFSVLLACRRRNRVPRDVCGKGRELHRFQKASAR